MDAALLRTVQTVDDVHHDGLSRTVGSDDGMDLTFSDRQIDTGQGLHLAKIHVDVLQLQECIPLFEIICFDQYPEPPLKIHRGSIRFSPVALTHVMTAKTGRSLVNYFFLYSNNILNIIHLKTKGFMQYFCHHVKK